MEQRILLQWFKYFRQWQWLFHRWWINEWRINEWRLFIRKHWH
jgi:hypothetical protein